MFVWPGEEGQTKVGIELSKLQDMQGRHGACSILGARHETTGKGRGYQRARHVSIGSLLAATGVTPFIEVTTSAHTVCCDKSSTVPHRPCIKSRGGSLFCAICRDLSDTVSRLDKHL
jgi:hypothetical protein